MLTGFAASAQAEWVTSFKQALGDRAALENWPNSLPDGDYKDGVKFWISQHILNRWPCSYDKSEFNSGCWQAWQRFVDIDYKRRHDPLYLEGWNAYGTPAANASPPDPRPVAAPPAPAPTPRPVAPPPVAEASIKLTPAGSHLFSVIASLNGEHIHRDRDGGGTGIQQKRAGPIAG